MPDLRWSTGRFTDRPCQRHLKKSLLSQTGCSRAVLCIKISSNTLQALHYTLSFYRVKLSVFLPFFQASTTLCVPFFCSYSHILSSVFQYSCLWPLSVIYVRCVAAYVSDHCSLMRSTLPGSDGHAGAHSALSSTNKADCKYSHFRGDALQWHEASRLNRSRALSPTLSLPLSIFPAFSEPLLEFTLFYCDKTQGVMAWIPNGSFLDRLPLFVCYHPDKMIFTLWVCFVLAEMAWMSKLILSLSFSLSIT